MKLEMENKQEILKKITAIFWIFIIGSIAGYIFEMIVVLFQKGYFESRKGVIYGPFIPVYGVGAVIYYLALSKRKDISKIKIFFLCMLLGGATEYIFSFLQEKIFGTISWDYSNLMFNINGRTSLLHCTYWGIAGIIYVTFVEPFVTRMIENINTKNMQILTVALSCFMVFNIFISATAAYRQKERTKNEPPDNRFEIFLDKYYTDEYLDKIFANKKEVDFNE